MKYLSRRLQAVPRDLVLVLTLRLWQAGAGLLTTLFAVHYLSPELQGWYYSFISVAALYTLFDLGLSTVLVQVSAHAFAGLRWVEKQNVEGPGRDYFQALIGRAARWYTLIALLFVILLIPGGLLFFSSKSNPALHWVAPWLVLCSLTAMGLVVMPFLAVLEGCGQIAQVYAVRLVQAVCGSLACWLMFASHAGLWATTMLPTMAITIPLGWLFWQRRGLFVIAWQHAGRSFDWRSEVWPLQWRLGINWLCGYLLTQINIPILFHTHGAVVAGQLGLSLAVVNTLSLVAQSWIVRRVPTMARAVALRDWPTFDRIFRRDFSLAIGTFVAGTLVLLVLFALAGGTSLAHRVLPFPQFAGLLAFTFANLVIAGLSAHLRSFKREPLTTLLCTTTLLMLPAILWASSIYSSAGMISVLAAVNIAINLPLSIVIWHRCIRLWKNDK